MTSFHALWCKGILIDYIHTRATELSGAVDSGAQPSIAGSKNSLRVLLDRTSRLLYTYDT